jgi:hypothetical protein
MGRMKEEFMEMQEQMQELEERPKILRYDEFENYHASLSKLNNLPNEEEYINQQNQIDMKKVENGNKLVEVKETKKETLRRLFKANNLVEEDVYKDKRGFVIITRTGIDKIVSKQKISVAYEPVVMTKDWVVLKAIGSMKTGDKETDVRNMMSFGEASDDNLVGGGKKFPVAMAEKRAMSRVVLKIAGFYEQGVFGQDEIVD